MLLAVNNEIVLHYKPIKYIYGNKYYESFSYNNNKIIKQHDKVKFICSNCDVISISKFSAINKEFLCKACKTKKTNLKKYGAENVFKLESTKEKIKQTKLQRYGNKNYNNSEQTKQTNLEKYGVTSLLCSNKLKDQWMFNKYKHKHALQISKIKEKVKKTNLEKYGVENVSQYYNNKIKKTKLVTSYNKYLELEYIIPLFTLDEYLEKQHKCDKFMWECKTCHTQFKDYYANGREPRCPTCYPKLNGYSKKEKELTTWCKTFTTVIENNRSILNGKEIDIYLPNYKLAIEYNGLYWHSIKLIDDKWYHQNKVELAYRRGIRLLHIWEYQDMGEIKDEIQYYINNIDEYIKVEKPKLYNIDDNLIWI